MDRRTGNLTNTDGKPLSIKERIEMQEKSTDTSGQLSTSKEKKPIEIPKREGGQAQPVVSEVNKKDANNTSGGLRSANSSRPTTTSTHASSSALPTQSSSTAHSNNPTPPSSSSPLGTPPRPSTSPTSLSVSRDSKQLEREREQVKEEQQAASSSANLQRGSSTKLQKKEKNVNLPKYSESVAVLPKKPSSTGPSTHPKPLPVHAKPTTSTSSIDLGVVHNNSNNGPPTDLPPPIDLPPDYMPSHPPPSDLPPSDLPPNYHPPSFDDGPPSYSPSMPPTDISSSDYPGTCLSIHDGLFIYLFIFRSIFVV
jgi:hypothetical protein